MRLLSFALGLSLGVCILPAYAQAELATQTSPTAAELGAEVIAHINSSAPSRAFVEARFSTRALQSESAAQRAATLDAVTRLSGGFDVISSTQASPQMVEMLVRSRNGARTGRIVLFASSREPGKISDVFLLGARDPAKAALDAFPEGSVSDRALVRMMSRRIDNLATEGLFSGAVLVAKGDKILLREARGYADAATATENTSDTRFNIASMSKMWTAVIVLKLVENGVLSLEDSVAKWVPSYPHADAAANMTVRSLLQHTSGVGPWDGRAAKIARTTAQAAEEMTAAPVKPGSFSYSNAGYVLLAAAAEKATGQSYEALVHRYIFAPAGMAQSGLWPVSAIVTNRARGYLRPSDDPLGFRDRHANEQFLGYGADGSGGAYSTVTDIFKFHRALATGRLLSSASVALMQSQTVPMLGAPRPTQYGLGLRTEICSGHPMIGHAGGGAGSGVSAVSFASPNGEWTIVVLGNVDPEPETLAFDICELVNRN